MKLPKLLLAPKGFSLIELLVVVSIMVTLLSIGVASYNSFNQTATLDGAYKNLRANLRLAQNFALSGERILAGGSPTCALTGELFNGYYIVFNTSPHSYQLYQDCQPNTSPTPVLAPSDTMRVPPGTINLPTNITFSAISSSPAGANFTSGGFIVRFKSVRGVEFFNSAICCSNQITPTTVTVTLCNGTSCSGSNIKTITISDTGKVE